MALLASALKWLFGGGMSGVVQELRGAYRDKLNATNDADRIAAEERIARAEVRAQSMGRGWMAPYVRAAWALPFIVYNAKLVVWDKVLGLGSTDPLSPELYYVQGVIIAFYFLTSTR
jgi:hypothetical protein